MLKWSAIVVVLVAMLAAGVGTSSVAATASARVVETSASSAPVTPIRHVVVIFQENHSFDNVLGGLCVADHLNCDGASTGVTHTGRRIALSVAPDVVPNVQHKVPYQRAAIDGGKMDGFDLVPGCLGHVSRCYSQYRGSEIPNLRRLAENYVISDRTFSEDPVPSWGGHLDLVAGQLDGFLGVGPTDAAKNPPQVHGWGCDSHKDSEWKDPTNPDAPVRMVPSCIPRRDGFGPYRPSPVKHIPTILDRLSQAGLSWKLYTDTHITDPGYIWSICPTLASCLYDPTNNNRPNPNWKDPRGSSRMRPPDGSPPTRPSSRTTS